VVFVLVFVLVLGLEDPPPQAANPLMVESNTVKYRIECRVKAVSPQQK
jgi:hypothetical protein